MSEEFSEEKNTHKKYAFDGMLKHTGYYFMSSRWIKRKPEDTKYRQVCGDMGNHT